MEYEKWSDEEKEALNNLVTRITMEKVTVNTTRSVDAWFKAGFGFAAGAFILGCLVIYLGKFIEWIGGAL